MRKFFLKIFLASILTLVFIKLISYLTFWHFFSNFKNPLQKELEELKYQNQLLATQISELKELKKENQLLKEALNLKEKSQKKIVLAKTIFISPFNFDSFFLINKGTQDGLKAGDLVLLNQKIIIGKIIEAKKNFSKVATFFSKENSTTVFLETEPSLVGALKVKNQKIFLDLIPKDKNLKTGEKIFTSGFDLKYPRGFLIGEIKKIDKPKDSPFLEIEIRLPYQWSQITKVLVLSF